MTKEQAVGDEKDGGVAKQRRAAKLLGGLDRRGGVGGAGGEVEVEPGRSVIICTRRAGKLYKARSRLYRSQILQVNMRLEALAEIYTMHSFTVL